MLSRWYQCPYGDTVKAIVTPFVFCPREDFSLTAFWIQNVVCIKKAKTFAVGNQHVPHQGEWSRCTQIAEDQAQKCFG